jgi:hypothetical protein
MVKKIIVLVVLIIPFIVNSCGILDQAGEYQRFVNSNFRLVNVEVLNISGVDVRNIKNASDLNMGDIMTLTGKMFNGGLPTKLKVNLEVENTSSKKASFSGMEWKFLMKDIEYTSGTLNKGVEVMPYSKKRFSVDANIDLLKILQSESLPQILNVVFNMDDREELKKLGLELKIKPYFNTASGQIKYPSYFTLKP